MDKPALPALPVLELPIAGVDPMAFALGMEAPLEDDEGPLPGS
ncbi:MAG TPA: hypothetical protein VK821_01640 [Dehalococcoidia bacterium]|nr:hypothetical protein [Dehalococcoidia bacterium]